MLNPREAVMGFAAWLTTRPEVLTLSENHDSEKVVPLIVRFCDAHGLPPISGEWPNNLQPVPDEDDSRSLPVPVTHV